MKFFLLGLLLFSSIALAYSPYPKEVGSSKVFIELNWTIDFGGKLPPDFTFTSFAYPSNAWQKARFEPAGEHSFVEEKDSFGNALAKFSFKPQKNVETVSLRALVDVNYAVSSLQQATVNYSQQTSLSEPSPEIAAKTKFLSRTSELETAVTIAEWVHNHVRYDGPGYGAAVENAQSTFTNAVGTCDEYSHLFSSMARAAGLPTKFVAGFVCSSDCGQSASWGAHAWNEVLIGGKWVPFDTTFNEALLLDATHVKFAEGRDQDDIKEKLSAIAFDFSLKDVKITRNVFVSLDEWKPFEKLFSLSLDAPNKTFGKSAIVPVTATLSSNTNAALAVPISIVAPNETRVAPAESALVLLQPSATATRSWNVLLPAKLDEGFSYNFTVQAVSLGSPAQASITASATGESTKAARIRVAEVLPSVKENELQLKISLENSGNEDVEGSVFVLTNAGNATQKFFVPAASNKQLLFSLPPTNVSLVEGTIVVKTGSLELTQPISILVEQPEPATPPVSVDVLVYAITAIVIILLLAVFILKKR